MDPSYNDYLSYARPRVTGVDFLVPPQNSGGYYSDDDRRYTGAYISNARVPSPPAARRRSFGGEVTRPSRERDRSDVLLVPSPPRTESRSRVQVGDEARHDRPKMHRRILSGPSRSDKFEQSIAQNLLFPGYGAPAAAGATTKLQRSKSERGSASSRPRSPMSDSDRTTKRSPSNGPSVIGDGVYRYTPLADWTIRLVKLFPERRTMIKCEIVHVPLEQTPPYVAVSYAWGDAGDTRKIEMEGCLVPISVSLHGALQALRQREDSVLVWADALCIDQGNKDEKNQQIRLMSTIYSLADSVAVWLGPEQDHSAKAVEFIRQLSSVATYPADVSRLLATGASNDALASVVSLFERGYWRRLWVVQELFNARKTMVYCGSKKLPWSSFEAASDAFNRHRDDRALRSAQLDRLRPAISQDQFSSLQVLLYQGPASLPDLRVFLDQGEKALLEILRACRRQLAADPRDKVFGVLGVLPADIRGEFRVDYGSSVKDVYTEVLDFVLKTTQRLDVICEAMNFPARASAHDLPSFTPDWSHIPQTTALGRKYKFAASGTAKAARVEFVDERLSKLQISAIPLDTIGIKGVAVGTLCNVGDYIMAFLHWRALLLGHYAHEATDKIQKAEQDFAATLCLGQIPASYTENQFLLVCFHIFAGMLHERLPYLPLDAYLHKCLNTPIDVKPDARRDYLQKHFGDKMMGRSFCITKEGRLGMGTGAMLPGDEIVVPLGCSTPVILRPDGSHGEYRFVGDAYVHKYMTGKAVEQWKAGKRKLKKYVLH